MHPSVPAFLPDLLQRLPPVVRLTDWSPSCYYGADYVAARYCGLKRPPVAPLGVWQHGWTPRAWLQSPEWRSHPAAIIGADHQSTPDTCFWLGHGEYETFLQAQGYRNAKAIGLPMAYLPPVDCIRYPGSLLVMPVHSLAFTTHTWNFEAYVDAIDRIRGRFTSVVVCVHESCFKRGFWIDCFRDRGYPVIQGAGDDRNTLLRMQLLMSSFEYVTSNSFGSHLVYAPYFGARVSVYGPYASLQKSDLRNDPSMAAAPEMLDSQLRQMSEAVVRRDMPFVFCEPDAAIDCREWAQEEIGVPFKVPPAVLQSLLGWSQPRVTRRRVTAQLGRLKRSLGYHVRRAAELALSKPLLRSYRDLRTVLDLPARTAGVARVYGRPFRFVDSTSFLQRHREIIQHDAYRISTPEQSPLIIDGGASVGLSVLYFKRRYPQARILAFEPAPAIVAILRENCEAAGCRDVQIMPQALWSSDGQAKFRCDEQGRGRLATRPGEHSDVEVETRRLRDLLRDKVTLLKLSIDGAEIVLLEDCEDLLINVENIIICYNSVADRPQTLYRIFTILQQAGFRLHLHTSGTSPSPLFLRSIRMTFDVFDMALTIFGFRP